jgi:SAM-dependent MidA family methyltransferase
MASSSAPRPPIDPAFAAAFRDLASGAPALRFDAFMRLALYHPMLGYYRRPRLRVGRERSADFYTATSLGPIFGRLVAAACASLLRSDGLDPATHTFVEVGAEASGGVLEGPWEHPFAAARTLRLGDPLEIEGPCIVFSNELFDAQPLRRFVRRASAWHELGVALGDDDRLAETDLGPAPVDLPAPLPPLDDTPLDYHFDAPFEAAELATRLAAGRWSGLFVAFDYGKSFAELAHSVPVGSARAYHRHTLTADLLAHPGEQDLTSHVCWDWLRAALAPTSPPGRPPRVDSQESFLVHHAGPAIEAILARDPSPLAQDKRSLLHLLHPGQMGQKFQVLHAFHRSPA